MTSNNSHPTSQASPKSTESMIHDAFIQTSKNKIVRHPLFLDDEELPDEDRLTVLREVFNRNIRQKQLQRLARDMAPVLTGGLPSNLLIYGPSGTGKSVTCLHFLSTLASMCAKNNLVFNFYYVHLTGPKTCFGALNELAIGIDRTIRRYKKGIAIAHMEHMVIQALSKTAGLTCILIDEVDNINVDTDAFCMFLAKALPRKVPTRLFYIFLTNRLEWDKTIDPRILSVLKKTDLIFEPYDAMDLVEILNLRVEKALDPNKVDPGAVRKIAAHASRETGDARKAVELLVKAVKIAEETTGHLGEKEVDEADKMLEVDKTEELIKSLALQQKLALIACYTGLNRGKRKLSTGHAYELYLNLCEQQNTRALTQRRFSDMVSFLDIYGLINARLVSKGRYGKTRELTPSLPTKMINDILDRRRQ